MAGMVLRNNPYAASQARIAADERARQDSAKGTQQRIAAQRAAEMARKGVASTQSGIGPDGQQWTLNTPGGGGSSAARRTSAGSSAGGGAVDPSLQKISFNSAFNAAKTSLGPAPPPIPMPAAVAGVNPADDAAAQAAAFGRAKDETGATTRAALDQLSDEMSGRGIAGGGIEGALAGQILQTGQGQLGEATRSQALEHLRRLTETKNANYQGDVAQRGQSIGYANALNSNAMQAFDMRRSLIPLALNAMVQTGGQLY